MQPVTRSICVGQMTEKNDKGETRLVYDQGEKTPATNGKAHTEQVPVWRTSKKETKWAKKNGLLSLMLSGLCFCLPEKLELQPFLLWPQQYIL